MRSDKLPTTSTRFFARVLSAVLECPYCGTVAQFGPVHKGSAKIWDAKTSRYSCNQCGRTFLIGLLAWPIRKGGQLVAALPRDQVPNERQLAELRAQGDGHWMTTPKPRHRPDDTNRTARCTCPDGAVHAGCVYHGHLAKQLPDESDQ